MSEYVTDPEINVILLGDESTGKSALVQSYLYDTFPQEYIPSYFQQICCNIDISNPNYEFFLPKITLNIHDMSGKKVHKSMRKKFYKNADIIILCYSNDDLGKSLQSIENYWIKHELEEYGPRLRSKSDDQSYYSKSQQVTTSQNSSKLDDSEDLDSDYDNSDQDIENNKLKQSKRAQEILQKRQRKMLMGNNKAKKKVVLKKNNWDSDDEAESEDSKQKNQKQEDANQSQSESENKKKAKEQVEKKISPVAKKSTKVLDQSDEMEDSLSKPCILCGTKSDQFMKISQQFEIAQKEFEADNYEQTQNQIHKFSKKNKDSELIQFGQNFQIDTKVSQLEIQNQFSKNLDQLLSQYEFISHIQCSALTGEGIKKLFDEAIYHMLKSKKEEREIFLQKQREGNQNNQTQKKESKGFASKFTNFFKSKKNKN